MRVWINEAGKNNPALSANHVASPERSGDIPRFPNRHNASFPDGEGAVANYAQLTHLFARPRLAIAARKSQQLLSVHDKQVCALSGSCS
jgi:hypothetical protein